MLQPEGWLSTSSSRFGIISSLWALVSASYVTIFLGLILTVFRCLRVPLHQSLIRFIFIFGCNFRFGFGPHLDTMYCCNMFPPTHPTPRALPLFSTKCTSRLTTFRGRDKNIKIRHPAIGNEIRRIQEPPRVVG